MITSNKITRNYRKKSLFVGRNLYLVLNRKQKRSFSVFSFICNVCFAMFVLIFCQCFEVKNLLTDSSNVFLAPEFGFDNN